MTIFDERGGLSLIKEDILKSDCQTLTCPVNTVGVMGKGLAKTMARAFPGLLHRYRRACETGELTIDKLWVYKDPRTEKQILCFPTKKHWRNPSRLEWVENNLKLLAETWEDLGIESLAIPQLGCGLGGLDWAKEVYPLVYKHLDPPLFPVYIYIK